MNHNCPALYGTMGPIINMENLISNFTGSQEKFVRSISPEDEKQYYEQVLKESPGIITLGNEQLDLFAGTLLIFLALSGITNIYKMFTGDFNAIFGVIIDFMIIAPGFILHELSHKYMALKKKFYARYVLYEKGIWLTLLTALIGIGFIVPGFVAILGRPNKEENGEISIVGPATNIFFALIGLSLIGISQGILGITGGVLLYIFYRIVFINGFIALFNLLPFWNLDGAKVFKWNKIYWFSLTLISLLMFLFSIFYSP